MQPLTRQQFQDALRKGLGRAVLHVREHGLGEFEDDLLHACLHNLVYDALFEDGRADYLLFFLDFVADKERWRKRILAGLRESRDDVDTDQLFALARRFAQDGHVDAREAMYERFDRREDKKGWPGAAHIMALDDVDGMLHVAKVVGTAMRDGSGSWDDAWMVSATAERLGRDAVVGALEKAAGQDVDVRAFLESHLAQEAADEDRKRERDKRRPPTLEEVVAAVEMEGTDAECRLRLIRLRRHIKPEDLDILFQRMLRETRRDPLRRYLWLFDYYRPMPRLDARVVQLALSSEDEQLQEHAITALSKLAEPTVREIGLRLLQEQPTSVFRDAISLFELNYQPGDEKVIRATLPEAGDDDLLHGVGTDIIGLRGDNDLPELGECVMWVYEHTPCSYCRNGAFESLMKWNLAPAGMVAEAVWDACLETREQARKALREDRADAD